MTLEYKSLLDESFSPTSRVWIYQSNRLFTLSEALEIEALLKQFAAEWKSHGAPVKATGYLFFGQFIVLMADEEATDVSGCSTDGSVRFMKNIGERYNVDMFDRQMLAFFVKDKIQLLPLSQVQYALDNNFITPDTLYFNNIVTNLEQLKEHWIIPINESWLKNRININHIQS